jgi:hypothetical protein
MVCPDDARLRQKLETLYERSPAIPLQTRIMTLWQRLQFVIIRELTRDRSEPRITQAYDADGQIIWQVYDPFTEQRLFFASELEVRIWLENRYLN